MNIFKEIWNLFTKDSKIEEKKVEEVSSCTFSGFQDMCLQEVGDGQFISYDLGRYATKEVRWVSKEKDEKGIPLHTRIPNETTCVYKDGKRFVAAGRSYPNLKALTAVKREEPNWYKDIYGRDVLYFCNRFPCFDSYDYMTETRYYRWMFIFGDDTLTRVYHTDEQEEIFVTEDVRCIELDWWSKIQKLYLFDQ